MDELGKSYHSLGWWLGAIAEKNPDVSPLFLHLCYLQMAFETMERVPGFNWLVVVESDGLRRALAWHARRHGIEVHDLGSGWGEAWDRLVALARALVAKARFLISRWRLLLTLRRACWEIGLRSQPDGEAPLMLIHSWLLDGCLDEDGRFRDAYFGRLPSWLEEQGYRVQYLVLPATLMVRQVPPAKFLRLLVSSGRLFPAGLWLKWWDVMAATWLPLWLCRLPRGAVFCRHWNLSSILAEERRAQVWSNRTSDAYLYYALMKRLGRAALPIRQILYPFENHIWEKALCLGARRSGFRGELVGYQHANLPSVYLNFFPGPFERSCGALPDRLVCCGRASARVLAQSGYSPVGAGPALRYDHVWTQLPRPPHDRPVVLVCLSVGWDAFELVWKAHQAFKDDRGKRVILRPHPAGPLTLQDIEAFLGVRMPSHFEVSSEPLTQLLALSDVLVYTSSTVCYEALSQGVPVLCLEQSQGIDKDPLKDSPEGIRWVARTPQELAAWADRLRRQEPSERAEWQDQCREFLRDTFEPISEETMQVFLPKRDRT